MRLFILCPALQLLLLFLSCKGCLEEEREALLQVKSSINETDASVFSNWYGQDCCLWKGVYCDISTSYVVRITFRYIRTDQSSSNQPWYPNATLFAQFKYLQELSLSGNHIAGFISPTALPKLKHLQKLDLRDNSIADGSNLCWGHMPNLQILDLAWNRLQGPIPKCICENRYYTRLILSYNQLNGSLYECFSNMTSLRHLFLADNDFGGKFPSLLFKNLINIESFCVSGNKFKDFISFSIFSNLSKLTSFDISFNDKLEVETEFPTWSPSFSLNELKLAACYLNNRSGNFFPSFLSSQYSLQSLDLSHNSLVGSIPAWLIYNVSSQLVIRGNKFTGLFPMSPVNMNSTLSLLDISDNELHGPLPEDIRFLFPMLSQLNVSTNAFNGSIPRSFEEMKQLVLLDLSNNNFIGEMPHGILTNLTSLEYLSLSNNKLQGEPLPWNSSLPILKWLVLDRNSFSGSLRDSLSTYSSLLYLSLDYNDLSGDLSTKLPFFPQLRSLTLPGNRLRGQIPLQVCQMQHLHVLDLSMNELSGDIPSCLDNITSWTEESDENDVAPSLSFATDSYPPNLLAYTERIFRGMDISHNNLTGTIPFQVTKLARLHGLNMSNNLLTGQLPASLSDLQELESLDLSNNKLFGPFPDNLTNLQFLAVFNVSFNNLSGPIPEGKQFSTFDSSSYLGNPGLCGRPLEKTCERVGGKQLGESNKKPKLHSNTVFISISIVVNIILLTVEVVF